LAETEGFDAVNNKNWTSSLNGPDFELNGSNQIPSECETFDGPFSTLMRTMDWTIEDLDDVVGRWAMANALRSFSPKYDSSNEEYEKDEE